MPSGIVEEAYGEWRQKVSCTEDGHLGKTARDTVIGCWSDHGSTRWSVSCWSVSCSTCKTSGNAILPSLPSKHTNIQFVPSGHKKMWSWSTQKRNFTVEITVLNFLQIRFVILLAVHISKSIPQNCCLHPNKRCKKDHQSSLLTLDKKFFDKWNSSQIY